MDALWNAGVFGSRNYSEQSTKLVAADKHKSSAKIELFTNVAANVCVYE